ncbi:hypothetical protein ACVISU_001868 [Bradyrhizobium sp. USDA 4452]
MMSAAISTVGAISLTCAPAENSSGALIAILFDVLMLNAAEAEAVERRRVEPGRVGAVGWQRRRQAEIARHRRDIAERHIGGVGAGEAVAVVLPERQRAGERHGVLGQLVAVGDAGRAFGDLGFAVDHTGEDRALEDRGRGRENEAAGVAAHGIAVLPARAAFAERAEIDLDDVPVGVIDDEAVGHRDIGQIGRRIVGIVDAAVTAEQHRLLHIAALVLHRAAGDIEDRAALRHHLRRRQGDGAAERGPFADPVAGVVQIARHLEQAAGGVVAVGRIAAGAGRHQGEIAGVDPHVAVDERAAVAVLRTVAQLVALDVDLDHVGGRRQHGAGGAGDVDHGAGLGEHPLAGGGRHLAALRHGQRAVPEIDGAAGDDFDARLIGPIGQCREVVELAGRQQVRLGRGDQGIALRIERGHTRIDARNQRGCGIGLRQDQADAVVGQRNAAGGVGRRVEQMDAAALIDRGGGENNAVLGDGMPGQRDVALLGEDETGVGDGPAGAAAAQQRRDLVAAGSRVLVGVGAVAGTQDEIVAGRELGLALRRSDGAGIVDLGAHHEHEAAA